MTAVQNEAGAPLRTNIALDCGWGRLLFGPSFETTRLLAESLLNEEPGHRDIALYVDSPQLVLAEAPTELFLDPSLLFRRKLDSALPVGKPASGVAIRQLTTRADIAAINRLYSMRGMVPMTPKTVWAQRHSDGLIYLVAEDERTGDVIGSVMGVDHFVASGLDYLSVLADGRAVTVRKTANLHTGGTIHDVTPQLHPVLREAAENAARALRIPVVGLDFLVPAPDQPDYVIIEANERPGLANHEPQPTVQRLIDLLFPITTSM